MKHFSIFSLPLFSLFSFGQVQKTAVVKIALNNCRNNHHYPPFNRNAILFYKLPEDTFAFKVVPMQYKNYTSIQLDNVPVSDYKLRYRNNFKEDITRQVSITGNEVNFLALCPDSLSAYPQNTLEKLHNGDTISINFQSRGCFNSDSMQIVIKKQKNRFIASFYNTIWYPIRKKGKPAIQFRAVQETKTAILTESNINDYIKFENELNFATKGGCTTTDWYEIKSKYLNLKKTDGSCNWNGFYYLRKSFFGKNG